MGMQNNLLVVGLASLSKLRESIQRADELTLRGDGRVARQALAYQTRSECKKSRTWVSIEELRQLLVFLDNIDQSASQQCHGNRYVQLAL